MSCWIYVLREGDHAGIVYCSTTKQVDETARLLQSRGIRAAAYHAKLDAEVRRKNQDDFLYDRVQIMVATNAFGMGIDKPNVRFVIHYNMPKDLESYYQEAGRAGRRRSEPARCILLYSGTDVRTIRFFIDKEREADNGLPADVKAEAARKAEERLKYMTFYSTTPRVPAGVHAPTILGRRPRPSAATAPTASWQRRLRRQMEQRAAEAKQRAAASARRLAEKPRRRPADVELSADGRKAAGRRSTPCASGWPASRRSRPISCSAMPPSGRWSRKSRLSTDELLNITGVGEKKAARYGTIFLAAIEKAVRSR